MKDIKEGDRVRLHHPGYGRVGEVVGTRKWRAFQGVSKATGECFSVPASVEVHVKALYADSSEQLRGGALYLSPDYVRRNLIAQETLPEARAVVPDMDTP